MSKCDAPWHESNACMVHFTEYHSPLLYLSVLPVFSACLYFTTCVPICSHLSLRSLLLVTKKTYHIFVYNIYNYFVVQHMPIHC